MVRSVTPAGRTSGPRFSSRLGLAGALGAAGACVPALVLAGWVAIHRIPGLAPALADGLRRLIGSDRVTRLEEVAYGLEDRFYSVWRRGEPPRAYWAVPEPPPASPGPRALQAAVPREAAPAEAVPSVRTPFQPHDVGPMYAALDAPGDGRWLVLPEGTARDEARMFKTLLHPDPERAWAELFVVALDLRRVRLHLVPGTVEPQPTVADAVELSRPGRVPDEHHAAVLAAFNGGFKTEHGRYGTRVHGVTLVPPREKSCTIAWLKDDTLRIATWAQLREVAEDAAWWRQTPDCMYEGGELNPRLAGGRAGRWGSALDGETVIRRSAIGLDAAGTTLFVGISNHTTAPVLARGMHHAGALDVAQLDVNFSYPKFVTFRESPASRLRLAVPLAEGFEVSEHEYLRKPSQRDFFYVMDSALDGRTARN